MRLDSFMKRVTESFRKTGALTTAEVEVRIYSSDAGAGLIFEPTRPGEGVSKVRLEIEGPTAFWIW